jgi:DNA-binding transcriptional LysR family regulator
MELHQLRIFVTVADTQNLTQGARRLYLTPSAVSAHIKALEDELGVPLFVRTARGMALTDHGTRLKASAEAVLLAARALQQQATTLRPQLLGHLRCGRNAAPSFLRVAAVVQAMHEAHPGIVLDWVASSSGAIIEELRQGTMDAGYIFGPPPTSTLTTHCLGLAEVVIAAPRQWETQLVAATWADLAQLPWISSDGYCPFQTLTDALFQQRGLQYRRIAQTNDDLTKTALIAAGVGVAMLERSEAEQAELVIWDTAPMHCALHLAYSTARQDAPAVQALRAAVLQVWGGEERVLGRHA